MSYLFFGGRRLVEIRGSLRDGAVASMLRRLSSGGAFAALVLACAAFASALTPLRRMTRRLAAAALALAVAASGCRCRGGVEEGIRFFHYDHLGSVTFQTDGSGAVHGRTAYDPYGAPLADGQSPWGFGGKEWLPGAGLSLFEARPYDARIGRFLAPDPAAASPDFGLDDPQLLSVYAYARNTVSFFIDLLGLTGKDIGIQMMMRARAAYEATTPLRDRVALEAQTRALVREAEFAHSYQKAPWHEQVIFELSEYTGGNDMARGWTGADVHNNELSLWERVKTGVKGVVTAAGWATTVTSAGKVVMAERAAVAAAIPKACPAGWCQCFVAGTPVVTEAGLRPIESIKPGDLVLSKDPSTGKLAYKPVARTFVTPDSEYLWLDLAVDDGLEPVRVGVTGEHPFWLRGKGWVPAREVRVGEQVGDSKGGWLRVTGTHWAAERVTTYNFEVEDFHTYFVTELEAWVHNTCADAMRIAASPGRSPVKVIGRLEDTAVAKDWAGHEVLDIPDWTLAKNDAWIQSGIAARQNFYLASPRAGNMVQTTGRYAGQPTVFARELEQLEAAGYKQIGDYMVHPDNVGTFVR